MSFLPISAKYHKWTIKDLHQKWKEIQTWWKQNTNLLTSKRDPPHSKHSNNVYMPWTIDSPDIKGDKNNTSKTITINKQSKLFEELRGNRITIIDAPTKKTWESSGSRYMRTKKDTIKTRHGCRNTKPSSITSRKRHIVR